MSEIPQKNPLQILIVEDDPTDYRFMRAALVARFNCEVQQVTTQDEFEAAIRRNPPKVIISDSNVAEFDGFTALTMAKQKCPEASFVFCSGFFPFGKQKEAFRNGTPWILKASGYQDLVAVVQRLQDSPPTA